MNQQSCALVSKPIHAAIGVMYKGDHTYYVKRSKQMQNYPDVWSLFSIQFPPEKFSNPPSLLQASLLFKQMSAERLFNMPIITKTYMTSGSSDENPMETMVNLHFYEISMDSEPAFNPAFYSDGAWMTQAEYEVVSATQTCGLCTRLWSDFAWKNRHIIKTVYS